MSFLSIRFRFPVLVIGFLEYPSTPSLAFAAYLSKFPLSCRCCVFFVSMSLSGTRLARLDVPACPWRVNLIRDSVKRCPVFAVAPELTPVLTTLLHSALAASTLSGFVSHEKAFLSFCKGHGVIHPFPLLETVVCAFLCFYFSLNKPYSAAKRALEAVAHLARLAGTDASSVIKTPRVSLLRRGYIRLGKKKKKRVPRIPVTVWMLVRLLSLVASDEHVFFAICCVGVFGLFRGGELTYKGPDSTILRRRHVTWFDTSVVIRLVSSKTDFELEGVDVRLYANDSRVCPYTWLRRAWDSAPLTSPSDPLFQQRSGIPVSYSFMLGWMKNSLVRIGIPASAVGLHSLRIGGATSLAMLGIPAHIIKILGRWESYCYQLYTRASDDELRRTMSVMATASESDVDMFGGLGHTAASLITESSLGSLPRVNLRAQHS
jgi:hypothetical protein